MGPTVTIIVVLTTGYLIGSVPVANHVARRHGVADLRSVGDRNPGFWNAQAAIGREASLPIFVGDVLKGALPALFATSIAGNGQWWMPYLAGGAAMVGHAWPVFAGFRGGRGVLTFVGAGLICAPVPALMAAGVTAAVWAARRDFAWAARAGVFSFPIIQLVTEGAERTAATGALMTLIGVRFAQASISGRRGDRAKSSAARGRSL